MNDLFENTPQAPDQPFKSTSKKGKDRAKNKATPSEGSTGKIQNANLERIKVLLPLPIAKPFDYTVAGYSMEDTHTPTPNPTGINPTGISPLPKPGDWVKVPFGNRQVNGVVWFPDAAPDQTGLDNAPNENQEKSSQEKTDTSPIIPLHRLKSIISLYDAPALAPSVMKFIDWVAQYTLFPPGAVLRMVMRNGEALTPPKGETAYLQASSIPKDFRVTPQRQAILDLMGETPQSAQDLSKRSGVSSAVIRGLAKSGAIHAIKQDPDAPFDEPDTKSKGPDLSDSQSEAAQQLCALIGQTREPQTALLDGVTGSGKTEVYLEAVRAALEDDPAAQILVLLPEIALTLPFLNRIETRFNAAPAGWHSDMTPSARRRVWRRVLEGQARLVVGARSALFLPFKNLKMIIVDEEHESAYKQEDGVLYQGRDMAVARGALDGFPVILASATPSLETMINASDGRYQKISLAARYGNAQLPQIQLIDMRETPPEKVSVPKGAPSKPQWISPPLAKAISEGLAKKEQSLLFLNRRGFAPLTICRKCGHRMKSPHSDTCLVEHRFQNRLVCHHTGYSIPKPRACPTCNTVDGLVSCGPGVERIATEAKERWPHGRIEILSSDSTVSPTHMQNILSEMQNGSIDILVATQAAAKGHHFPNLTLVGVIDADMGLAGGDLRAAERTYQLLSQVAGRAGRAEKAGRAMLQTYRPDAPVLKALLDGNRDRFLAAEAQGRIQMVFPPFGRLAAITLKGRDEKQVQLAAKSLIEAAPKVAGIEIWGPAPAPIYKLKGDVRIKFLVRAKRSLNLQAFIKDWTQNVKIPAAIKRTIDIDPYSFM